MHELVVCSERDGKPVLDRDGNPVMFVDVLAEVGRQALEEGFRLEVAENENGETMFRLVEIENDDGESSDN